MGLIQAMVKLLAHSDMKETWGYQLQIHSNIVCNTDDSLWETLNIFILNLIPE